MATATRSRRRLPRPPMSPASTCAATALSSMRWSRARRSRNTMRNGSIGRSMSGCQGVFGFRNYIAGWCSASGNDKVRILTDRVEPRGSFGVKCRRPTPSISASSTARASSAMSGQMDRRPLGQFSVRHAWPRRRGDSRIGARPRRPFSGGAPDGLRQSRRGLHGAPGPATNNAVRNTLGVYKTPLIEVSTKCTFTNTTPVGAYRGAGRPEGNYYIERLLDTAAAELGIDQDRAAPAQPHPARGDAVYEPQRSHL